MKPGSNTLSDQSNEYGPIVAHQQTLQEPR